MRGEGSNLCGSPTPDEVVLALVVSDFGRDAALRFCAALAAEERAALRARLPAGTPFFDEHRRLTLSVVGDLPFVKAPILGAFRRDGRSLDAGVLVGFPGGPSLESVILPIGVLVLEALAGPSRRGLERAIVLLPCNTLAPVSWALAEQLSTLEGVHDLVVEAGLEPWPGLDALAERIGSGSLEVTCPTVPGAVLRRAEKVGARAVVPWGTESIAEVYGEAASRSEKAISVTRLDESGQETVRHAILAAIDGGVEVRGLARRGLECLAAAMGEQATPVEACTDLDYGVGLDSVGAYARVTVDAVFGTDVVAPESLSRGSAPL